MVNDYEFLYISHDCPNHRETVLEHILMCIDNSPNDTLKTISFMHDLGKPVVKEFVNGIARYHQHGRVSPWVVYKDHMKRLIRAFDEKVISIVYAAMLHMEITKDVNFARKILDNETFRLTKAFSVIDEISRIADNVKQQEVPNVDVCCKHVTEASGDKELHVAIAPPSLGAEYSATVDADVIFGLDAITKRRNAHIQEFVAKCKRNGDIPVVKYVFVFGDVAEEELPIMKKLRPPEMRHSIDIVVL